MGYYIDFVFEKGVTRDEVLGRISRVGAVRNTEVPEGKPLDEFWYPGSAAWTGKAIQVLVYAKECVPEGNWAHTRLSWATEDLEWLESSTVFFRFADDVGCRVYDGQIKKFVTSGNWRDVILGNFKRSARAIVGMVGSISETDIRGRQAPAESEQAEDLWYWCVRTENCLRKAGISTIDELLLRSEEDLEAIPNLGRKGLNEIRDRLAAHGLALRGKEPPG